MSIKGSIKSLTKDGHTVAQFLVKTMEGQTDGVKVHHRLDAAKQLIKYGFSEEDSDFWGLLPTPEEFAAKNKNIETKHDPAARPVTHLDILNYQIAHLIRHETAEGHTLVEFLIHTMTGRDRPFTPKKFRIKPADRMAAARELLRRGFGELGSRRKQSDITDEANAYDTLHTDLAKRMREYSERGADTVRFLLEVMSDPDPDQEFTIHHRMSAAQELLRRGWDTNYDNIRPEHLQAYWRDKESSRLSIGQKKTQAGLSTSIDDYDNHDDTDYEAIAQEMREEEDRDVNSKPLRFQETVPSSRHSSESRNLEDRQAASKSRHSRAGGNPEGQGEAANNPPLPQGEGWGEGTAGILNKPLPPRLEKSLPPAKAGVRMGVTEPASNGMLQSESGSTPTSKLPLPKGEGWGEGSNESPSSSKSTPAKAKYRRIDVKPEKNIYDYGPNDPDPTIDYYFEPLNPEEQAKFDKEERREHGLTDDEAATNGSANPPSPNVTTDSLAPIKQVAALHNTPILPNPLAAKHKNPTIRSP